jgi:hypothetical protein
MDTKEYPYVFYEVKMIVEVTSSPISFGLIIFGGAKWGEVHNEARESRHFEFPYSSFKEGSSSRVSSRCFIRPRNCGIRNINKRIDGGLDMNDFS